MITKTSAIALRINPFSSTSQVVVWLTSEHGRLVTMVKGRNRPKSAFLGQYDLFYTCELLFYSREHNGMHIARECSPLATRSAFRTDWRSAIYASYACDLISRTTFRGNHHQQVYSLTTALLDQLIRDGARSEFVFWFELRLLHALGFAPRLSTCACCGSPVPANNSVVFATDRGGILCNQCKDSRSSHAITVPMGIIAILKCWQDENSINTVRNIRCSREQESILRKLLGAFLTYHLDTCPESRNIAFDSNLILN